ncbi:MAG: lantibiotic dehydratase, partial [Gemmatimonadetes bacterium]|nr:lantibiotic dehydratase [Gemmatimonadota bacterium]
MTTLAHPAPHPVGGRSPDAVLLPHFVCRLSGLPVGHVESLRGPRCEALLSRLHDLERRLAAARDGISALLHEAVRAGEEGEGRRHLVQLRRDLYNLRPARPAALEAARAILSPAQGAEVEAFAAILCERAETTAALREAHAGETRAARRRFRALLDDPGFQKGLLVSSRTLHGAQERYRAAGDAALGGKLEKTERGLLRYFTRTAMKATPFATLCAVVPGTFVPAADGEGFRLDGDPLAKRSVARLNKQVHGIATHFLLSRRDLRPHLHVELNPTVAEEGDRIAYLAVHQGREAFQRLPRNPVVELVAATVAERGHLPLGELARVLAAHPDVEATEEEALAYVGRLVDTGLLRFRLGIREQDVDWDLPMRALLESIPDERAHLLAGVLAKLRREVARFESAGVEERDSILAECRRELESLREPLKLRGVNLGMLPFMEDATADASVAIARAPGVLRVEEALES